MMQYKLHGKPGRLVRESVLTLAKSATCAHMRARACTRASTHTHTHTHTRASVHTHMHMLARLHTHMHMLACLQALYASFSRCLALDQEVPAEFFLTSCMHIQAKRPLCSTTSLDWSAPRIEVCLWQTLTASQVWKKRSWRS